MNKKGITQYLILPVMLLFLTVIILISFFVIRTVNISGAFDVYQESEDFMDDYTTRFQQVDLLPLLIFIAWVIAICISGFLAPTHPIIFIIYFFSMIAGVYLAPSLANIYIETANSGTLAETAAFLTITNNLMTNLPLYMVIAIITSWLFIFGGWKIKSDMSGVV